MELPYIRKTDVKGSRVFARADFKAGHRGLEEKPRRLADISVNDAIQALQRTHLLRVPRAPGVLVPSSEYGLWNNRGVIRLDRELCDERSFE